MSSTQRKTKSKTAKSGNETTNQAENNISVVITEQQQPESSNLNLVEELLNETEEERELREEEEARAKLEAVARARAERKAKAEIITLREAKAETYTAEAKRKRAEAERLLKEAEEAEEEAERIKNGERDDSITKAETDKNAVVRVVVGGTAPKPQAEKTEGEKVKREHKTINRPALSSVLKSPSRFRCKVKGQVFYAESENGESIVADGKAYDRLNKWLDAKTKEVCGKNSTKISVYDGKRGVEIFIKAKNEWIPMGDVLTETTTEIN